MQTVEFTINHLTGKGWQDWTDTVNVDETIGLNAGRDEYATARGTVKQLIRKHTICHQATRATVKIGSKIIHIWLENGKFLND